MVSCVSGAVRAFACLVITLGLASCDLVRDEVGVSEGFVGPQADRLLTAQTQRQRADRYSLAMMVLAPLALETARDEAETRATIERVNHLYGSLDALYKALEQCSPGAGMNACRAPVAADDTLPLTGYNFESLAYEVQSDLYFVARSVVVNLDLREEVEDLLSLDVTALTRIWSALPDVFPAARRTAAGYRDGIVLFADAIAATCGGKEHCADLDAQLAQQFRGGTDGGGEGRELFALLRAARQASDDNANWRLQAPQFRAMVAHLDRSCARVFLRQIDSETDTGELSHCGAAWSEEQSPVNEQVPASTARDAFFATVAG